MTIGMFWLSGGAADPRMAIGSDSDSRSIIKIRAMGSRFVAFLVSKFYIVICLTLQSPRNLAGAAFENERGHRVEVFAIAHV